MAVAAFSAAIAAINSIQRSPELIDDELLAESERADRLVEELHATADPLVRALMSTPDPKDDRQGLLRAAHAAADWVDSKTAGGSDQRVERYRQWLIGLREHAADLLRVRQSYLEWSAAQPGMAPWPVRSAAVTTLALGRRAGLTAAFNADAVTAAMRALGPRLLLTLAEDFLSVPPDRAAWAQLLIAMDEVACWAGATAGHGVPTEFTESACGVLLEVAGHPELAHWAITRLPVHRLSRANREELAGLLAARAELMPFDWLAESDQLATTTVEVAYLRTLDAVAAEAWPGEWD